jgi:hypothetical protein
MALILVLTLYGVHNYRVEIVRVPRTDRKVAETRPAGPFVAPEHVAEPEVAVDPRFSACSSAARRVLGAEGDMDVAVRWRALRELTAPLSVVDFESLVVFLQDVPVPEDFTSTQNRMFKNDLMNVLRLQADRQDQVANVLMGVARDEAQDPVVREYALQHLALLCGAAPETRGAVHEFLRELADAPGRNLAGTSLISLYRLAEYSGFKEKDELVADAFSLASSTDTDIPTRLTALQVCMLLGDARALALARNIVNESESVPLKMSAIATLGEMGTMSDALALEQMIDHTERPLRGAVAGALERLMERLSDG